MGCGTSVTRRVDTQIEIPKQGVVCLYTHATERKLRTDDRFVCASKNNLTGRARSLPLLSPIAEEIEPKEIATNEVPLRGISKNDRKRNIRNNTRKNRNAISAATNATFRQQHIPLRKSSTTRSIRSSHIIPIIRTYTTSMSPSSDSLKT